MSSIIKVDTIQNQSGANIISESANTITVGASGDTVTIPSGATLDVSSATVTGTGITEADQWLLTSAVSYVSSQNTTITSNLARSTGDFDYIGTGMSESSGVFTFPSTGIWQITSQAQMYSAPAEAAYAGVVIQINSGDGTFTTRAENHVYIPNVGSPVSAHMTAYTSVYVDVTNATDFKVRFQVQSTNSFVLNASATNMRTGFTFIRLGDT